MAYPKTIGTARHFDARPDERPHDAGFRARTGRFSDLGVDAPLACETGPSVDPVACVLMSCALGHLRLLRIAHESSCGTMGWL